MVILERFGEHESLAAALLQGLNWQLTELLGEHASLELVSEPDDGLLDRMLEIEEEVFRLEDNVYSKAEILECLAEEDSLLLVLYVNGRVEGYTFGYDDEPADPVVEGTDYFMDTAVISLRYQARGLGMRIGLVVLFLVYLLGYRSIGITTEQRDKSGRELVKFYRQLGFCEAVTSRPDNVGMRISLSSDVIRNLARHLPVSEEMSVQLGI